MAPNNNNKPALVELTDGKLNDLAAAVNITRAIEAAVEKIGASAKQIAANRRNAQKSTGPKTEKGKKRSRMNALKHGMTSEKLLLRPDETVEYFDRCTKLIADMRPVGTVEEQLALVIAEHHIRLNALSAIQMNMLNLDLGEAMEKYAGTIDPNVLEIICKVEALRTDCAGPKIFDTIGRQEGRTTRHVVKLMDQLEHTQDRRIRRHKGEDRFDLDTCEAYQQLLRQLNHHRKLEAEDRAEEEARLAAEEAAEEAAAAQAEQAAAAEAEAQAAAEEAAAEEPKISQVSDLKTAYQMASIRQKLYDKVREMKLAQQNGHIEAGNGFDGDDSK